MDRQYIRDAQIIERYLQGKLSPAEEEAFEEAYVADADVLEELVLTERLREGLQSVAGPGAAQPAVRLRTFFGSPRYALAASIVAASALFSSGLLYLENTSLRSDSPSVAATNVRLLPVFAVRGASANEIEAPARDELTVLLLDPVAEYGEYRARLVRRRGDDSTELLARDGLTATYDDQIAFSVPPDVLTPGDYDVELSARREGGDFELLSRIRLSITPRP